MSTYERIMRAAVAIARKDSSRLTREYIAETASVTPSLLNHYFPTMDVLRSRVLEIAIDTGDAELLVWGIRSAHPTALASPPSLREEALRLLSAEVMGDDYVSIL